MKRSDIELMAPVGSYEALAAAIEAGADSVYFGVGKLNMRSASAANFTLDDLAQIVATAHAAGVKAYLTVNTIVYEEEIALMRTVLDAARDCGVDAELVEAHRYRRARKARHRHGKPQRRADASGYGKGNARAVSADKKKVRADYCKGKRPKRKTVQKRDARFLDDEHKPLSKAQIFVASEVSHRNRKRLRSDVSRHSENERLKRHYHRKLLDHALKKSHHGGHAKPQKEQNDKPRYPLFHA